MNTNALIEMLATRILKHFKEADWKRIELVLGAEHLISGHSRLMRSLHFGDKDYELHIFDVLRNLVAEDSTHLTNIKNYLEEKYPLASRNISAASGIAGELEVTVSPKAFEIPKKPIDPELIAVFLPSGSEFDLVFHVIHQAAQSLGLQCEQVDDLWDDDAKLQESFSLVYRSQLVLADLTGRDPSVFYGLGISHLLGRTVIPMAQDKDDLPMDMRRIRFLKYAEGESGLERLKAELVRKLGQHAPNKS